MKEALLLVFANKQDIPGGTLFPFRLLPPFPIFQLGKRLEDAPLNCGNIRLMMNCFFCTTAMTPNEVQERLKLAQLKDKIWYVVPSCATTGEGLFEGLVCDHLPFLPFHPANSPSAFLARRKKPKKEKRYTNPPPTMKGGRDWSRSVEAFSFKKKEKERSWG